MSDHDLLSYDDLIALLGVPRGTAYSLVARRQIPHIRLGPRLVRFRRGDIEAWLADRTVTPEGDTSPGRDDDEGGAR